ncbi:MAG: hypothetical protein IPH45_06720 [Bacteroidales bacterium]|nr:hypothetical protein [Bacteroidales bacterium]
MTRAQFSVAIKQTGSALIIERGSELNAIGTATEPIVFTSGGPAGAPCQW